MARTQRAQGISEEPMNIRNLGQSMWFILGAASTCALVACAENAVPPPVQPAATTNVCDAKDYRGATTADDRCDRAAWRGSAREGMWLSPAQTHPRT
jgi:hypothetical protein